MKKSTELKKCSKKYMIWLKASVNKVLNLKTERSNMKAKLSVLKELLTAPLTIIPKVDKEPIKTTITIMFLNWLLVSLGIVCYLEKIKYLPYIMIIGSVIQVIYSFLLTIALNMIGGKGKLKDALASLTYPNFGLALSFFIVTSISKIFPLLGGAIGIILFTIYSIIGIAGSFRVLKESFKVDIVTIWITQILLFSALILSAYLLTVLLSPFLHSSLPSFF